MSEIEGRAARIFGDTADTGAYVARGATERALERLRSRVADERGSAWLSAPPGTGKSLLLRVLAERLESDWRCVYVPYAALDLRDLSRWVIGRLGLEPRRPVAQQLASVARDHWAEGSALVLLIDDANAMPPDTARALGRRVRRLGSALRLVLASDEDARANRVRAALGLPLTDIRLSDALALHETRDYIETRLRVSGAGLELRTRFDEASIARIHRLSAGVPRRIHDLASEVESERPLSEDPIPADGVEALDLDGPELQAPVEAVEQWDIDPAEIDLAPLSADVESAPEPLPPWTELRRKLRDG